MNKQNFKNYLEESFRGIRFHFPKGDKIPFYDIEKNRWSVVSSRRSADNLPAGIHYDPRAKALVFSDADRLPSNVNIDKLVYSNPKDAFAGKTPESKYFVEQFRSAARLELIRKSAAKVKKKDVKKASKTRVDVEIDRVIYPTDDDVAAEVRELTRHGAMSFRRR